MTAPRLCGARTRSGGTCRRPAMTGTSRCDMHGSKAPQVQAAVRRREEERHVRTLLERLGEPTPLGHPVEALIAVASESRAWLSVLRERLAELPDFDTLDRTGAESAVVALYERSLDRTGRMLHELARLDLDTRVAVLEEERVRGWSSTSSLRGPSNRTTSTSTLARSEPPAHSWPPSYGHSPRRPLYDQCTTTWQPGWPESSSGAVGCPVGPVDRLTPPAPPTGTDQASDAGVRAASDMRMNGVRRVFEEHHPDLIDRRGVITEAAIDEAIRRLERELALGDKALAAHEVQNQTAEQARRAKRRAGESLAATEEHRPGPDRSQPVTDPPPTLDELPPTLDEAVVVGSDAPKPRLAQPGQIRQLRRLRVEIKDDLTATEAAQDDRPVPQQACDMDDTERAQVIGGNKIRGHQANFGYAFPPIQGASLHCRYQIDMTQRAGTHEATGCPRYPRTIWQL